LAEPYTWFIGGGETGEIATWIIAISILISTIISIMAFLGIAQSLQIRIWKGQIESRLRILESYVRNTRNLARKKIEKLGGKNPDELIDLAMDFFVIEPVSIEPTDIIRRLERVLRTGEERLEYLVSKYLPSADKVSRSTTETLLLVVNVLNTLYKYIRHILILGVKTRNAMLIAQLWMMLPFLMRIAKAYHDAGKAFSQGLPVGDSIGPLVARKLMQKLPVVKEFSEITKDTAYSVHNYKDRTIIVVKATGPGSTVGRPGEAVEKIAKEYAQSLKAIITVDAALKFEGEKTGSIAEGSGVAMGDPGPEKIRIERIATSLSIPLYAIAIKMGLEEAITAMKKEIAQEADKVVEKVLKLVDDITEPGDTVIVVGVGNTVGVAP